MPAAALCWIVGLYSFSKVPFYLFAQTPPHGFEVCALLGYEPDRSRLYLLHHHHHKTAIRGTCALSAPSCFWAYRFTTGFRGPKLFADPVLFLAPHDLMATAITLTLAVFVTGRCI